MSSNMFYQTTQELVKRVTETATKYPVATTLGGAAMASLVWTVRDFSEWKSFGTGGTPPTWAGYWRMTKFRLQRLMSGDDLRDPSPLSAEGPRYLKKNSSSTAAPQPPPRQGPRPTIIARTMPQRQRPEAIDEQARLRLQSMMRTLAEAHPQLLEVKLSKTEGRTTDAIYARPELATLNPQAKASLILDREIAHAHPADNSLHVWLSDPDARAVIEARWGERFPLAFVNSGWTMVYAPRTVDEVEVVEGIVRAGIAWVTGVEV